MLENMKLDQKLDKEEYKERKDALSMRLGELQRACKDAGIPVNDKENTDVYKPGSAGRRQVEAMVLVMAKTPLGRLCASDHAMNAVSEMKYLDEAFEALRRQTGTAMPMWEKLRSEMPPWETLQHQK